MLTLWRLGRRPATTRAVDNARAATTELSRRRVERDEVELFLAAPGTPRAGRGAPPRPA